MTIEIIKQCLERYIRTPRPVVPNNVNPTDDKVQKVQKEVKQEEPSWARVYED